MVKKVVKNQENHSVECVDIKLIRSSLEPLEEAEISESFEISIKGKVIDFLSISDIDVSINHKNIKSSDTPKEGYLFNFTYSIVFRGTEGIESEILKRFSELYSLSISWPYIREYVDSTFSRCGESDFLLPIINPQIMTQKLISSGSINIEIIKGKIDLTDA